MVVILDVYIECPSNLGRVPCISIIAAIANVRIHVERVIGVIGVVLQRYTILKGTQLIKRKSQI